MKYISTILMLFAFCLVVRAQEKLRGRVVDAQNQQPLAGAVIKIKTPAKTAISNNEGEFELNLPKGTYELQVKYLAYGIKELLLRLPQNEPLLLQLHANENSLQEVQVVSTGYQTLPKERATGSFVHIDNELLNRNGASTNLLERIDGITSGVTFNNNSFDGNGNRQGRQSLIEVRGRSTLFSAAEPLIVLDNFPYDGNLANINPNDVETITVLKDAAAASAWGARSANGVIVITTKKGKLNSAPKVSFNSSVNIAQKPDLYAVPQLSSAQFIEVQQLLFDRGAYNTTINNGFAALAPAVEIMLARRNGTITEAQKQQQLDVLRSYDAREQLLVYNYRKAMQQQYQTSVAGGTKTQKYFVSVGYNNNLNSVVNGSYQRLTLNASNTYYFLDNKLELMSNIIYTGSKSKTGPSLSAVYPYSKFADMEGNPLVEARDLRPSYASTAGNGKLLPWLYRPLDEVRNGYGATTSELTSYRLNFSLSYAVFKGLKVAAIYGFEKGLTDGNTLYELESYFARNAINRLSQINAVSGAVTYPMPMGGILNNTMGELRSHNGRVQANYNHNWGNHSINALMGSEIKDQQNFRTATSWYGYDPETGLNQNAAISYTTNYPLFYNPSSTSRINPNASKTGTTNRFLSYYLNASYSYNQKYTLSLSARRDESNLFGVATNQKGVPLWSSGVAWNLDREDFYGLVWLPSLKLRATYGHTGNVNNSISAYLTANNMILNAYDTNYATIVNPPNPDLRWEKVTNINLGLDFASKNNRLSGNIDFWSKKGIDLIGNSPIAPQTGISLYTGNSANTLTRGVDLQLNSDNLNGALEWRTTFLYNYTTSKVTDYKVSNGTNLNVVSANYNNPLEGYPYYALFSLRYAGLNASGAPQGYLNGEVSTNYTGIVNATDRSQLVYHGSAVPTSFGSLRNTFAYGAFELSFNVLYKFGYYFRRNSLNNSTLYSTGGSYKIADYDQRWKQPGDELYTSVPALVYPAVTNRTNLYTNAEVLVEKGDHIRLQDLRLGYTITPRKRKPFKSVNIFGYLNNLGILWRANNKDIDPDSPTGIPNVQTLAFGIRSEL
ncbi:SusC/RagA family TonB-linked outer membrane protein [Pedobacter helvus]|uniref:SusC/RagA family TonB-linked outer membrane protein n=1 Tax=Pedobacter helvus TaxID=2563444 RepID=A0ABW9JJE7_9SPHI|nr:SusC/RagA family TonB-linked outer membrane protein [Pedobacter ureilyticus]